LKDDISQKNQTANYGNLTARRTVIAHRGIANHFEDAPSSKRLKTEASYVPQNPAIPNTAASSRSHRDCQRGNKSRSRASLPADADITVVVDDDEDMGVSIPRANAPASSPDPLILRVDSSVFAPRSAPIRSGTHPFDHEDSTIPRPSYVEDSNTVQELRQRKADRKRKSDATEIADSESDSIEAFEDDMDPRSSKLQKGNVRKKINLFEPNDKKVPHLDLASVNKLRERKPIAGNMKPRGTTTKQTAKPQWVKFNTARLNRNGTC